MAIPAPLLLEGPNQFDGSAGATVEIAHDSGHVLNQGTFEVAFTADTVAGRRTLFSKDSADFNSGGHVTVYVENGDLIARLQSTSATFVVSADNVINAGQGHHAALTFGPDGLNLYLDGSLADQDSSGLQIAETSPCA